MSLRVRETSIVAVLLAIFSIGCQPTQPFFFMEDGDLSHYLGTATEIEYPDVEEAHLAEVEGAQAPMTIDNFDNYQMWDLPLEEVTRLTLQNSQVMRQLGGRIISNAPETLSRSLIQSGGVVTTYDPALVESGDGTGTGVPQSGTGVEAALSAFDANFNASVGWEKNDRPQNVSAGGFGGFFVPVFSQDLGRFTAEINKTTADGSQFSFRNNTIYDSNNNPTRALTSDWNTNFEAAFSHPILQGRGTQYNRIAGPFSFAQANGGFVNQFNGVILARIRHDQSLADFEGGVRNLLKDAEIAYWELYFAYRNLEAQKAGQKASLATWKTINELRKVGDRRGAAHEEARSRAQYFLFRAQVETALTDLLRAENRLRYIMGLSMSDGRLIRPGDEPTSAKVNFDWVSSHSEALARRVEIRKQKWSVKQRDYELIAARNHLLPRLDATGTYRWLGMGDSLVDSNRNGLGPTTPGSSAFESLTGGDYQEWALGLQFTMPIGFRRANASVRHHQLLVAREKALLQDLELEISHQLGDAVRDLSLNHRLSKTNFNRRVASQEEVQSYQALFDAGSSDPVTDQPVTADVVLDAQRRRFDAEVAYYRSLVDYNVAILRVHERKGSLLDYNGVALNEGPWPQKAYFDAMRRARKRDASTYLNYGFTRPNVISRGPVQRGTAGQPVGGEVIYEGTPVPQGGEIVPTPAYPVETGETIQPGIIVPENAGSATREVPSTNQVVTNRNRAATSGQANVVNATATQAELAKASPFAAPAVPGQASRVANQPKHYGVSQASYVAPASQPATQVSPSTLRFAPRGQQPASTTQRAPQAATRQQPNFHLSTDNSLRKANANPRITNTSHHEQAPSYPTTDSSGNASVWRSQER